LVWLLVSLIVSLLLGRNVVRRSSILVGSISAAVLALTPVAAYAHGGNAHALAADVAPTVTATAAWDPMGGGINVHITTTKFTFAPASVGKGYVQGEGHAHLTIDGNDVGRSYGEWVFIPTRDFGDGDHKLEVALEANDHGDYMVGADNMAGEDVSADVTFTIPKGQGFGDNMAGTSGSNSMAGMDMSATSLDTASSPTYLPWVFALGGIAFGAMLTWVLTAGRRRPVPVEAPAEKVASSA
jgi:hypothetical protein